MDDKTKNIIQNHIDTNDVCLFMKGTPDAPQCGFSMAVSNMLKILEINFKSSFILELYWENKIDYEYVENTQYNQKYSLIKMFRKFFSKKIRMIFN